MHLDWCKFLVFHISTNLSNLIQLPSIHLQVHVYVSLVPPVFAVVVALTVVVGGMVGVVGVVVVVVVVALIVVVVGTVTGVVVVAKGEHVHVCSFPMQLGANASSVGFWSRQIGLVAMLVWQ